MSIVRAETSSNNTHHHTAMASASASAAAASAASAASAAKTHRPVPLEILPFTVRSGESSGQWPRRWGIGDGEAERRRSEYHNTANSDNTALASRQYRSRLKLKLIIERLVEIGKGTGWRFSLCQSNFARGSDFCVRTLVFREGFTRTVHQCRRRVRIIAFA